MFSRELLKTYLQWDELAWGNALPLFESIVKQKKISKGLEIAANKGGISLFFANECNVSMRCTDLDNPETKAAAIMQQVRNKSLISFDAIDALHMKLPDESVDMLVFKSFLGGLHTFDKQQQAMNEIHRVLKPGGVLFFAENMKGSWMHRLLRAAFVSWSKNWRYLNVHEMNQLLAPFESNEIHTFGFFSACYRIKILQLFFYRIDSMMNNLLPASCKYIAYGYAIK